MVEKFDPAVFVPAAAAAVGLPTEGEELGDVIAAFAVLARVAEPLMAFALEDELVGAAVFRAGGDES